MAKLRDSHTSDDEAEKLSSLMSSWLVGLKVENLFQTCLSCVNIAKDGCGCKLYPGIPVPAHIVVNGCDKYTDVDRRQSRSSKAATGDDDIPF